MGLVSPIQINKNDGSAEDQKDKRSNKEGRLYKVALICTE